LAESDSMLNYFSYIFNAIILNESSSTIKTFGCKQLNSICSLTLIGMFYVYFGYICLTFIIPSSNELFILKTESSIDFSTIVD